ncbi:MAG TPA: serine hydrolase [Cyclobacteriaceae bacterium]|nr:serine hydrolase [Cyclobacteriaceae bacterium]
MKKVILLWFGAVMTLTSWSQAPTFQKQLPKVDAYVQQLMKEWKIAGAAVAIVYKDKVIFSKGYGLRDVDKKLPVTTTTTFGIASNTKLFTAVVAAMLHDEKKLDIDKPVRTYMPELKFATAELDEKLTLRDMLSHRSGVPRWDGVWAGSGYSLEEILDRLQYLKPIQGFREGYLYNNNMYATAGAVTAKVNGGTWEQTVTSKIFKPLNMNHSYFSFEDAEKAGEFSKDYYNGRVDSVMKPVTLDVHCTCWAPAAAIVSNVEDLSHWVMALLNGGKYNGTQAISSKALALTLKPNSIASTDMPYDEVFYGLYGLGRTIGDYKGHVTVAHGGVISGYRSNISIMPKDSIGIIILTNTAQGTPMGSAAVNGIYDRLLQLGETPWTKKIKAETVKSINKTMRGLDSLRALQVKGTTPSHRLAEFTGTYEYKAYGKIEISESSGQLQFKFRIWDLPLEHFHYDQFWTKQDPDFPVLYALSVYKLNFLTNEAGVVDKVKVSIGNDPQVEFVRVKK